MTDTEEQRKALAMTIGALNIVADVTLNPKEDNFLVTFMNGRTATIDNEIAYALAYNFALVDQLLNPTGVRPAW